METLKIHVFNGEPTYPGQRPPGESKDIYRKNALNKFKRLFGTKHKAPKPIIEESAFDNPLIDYQKNRYQNKSRFGIQDFELIKVIGRGSYAKVLLCKLKSTKQTYAMKVIKKELIADEEDIWKFWKFYYFEILKILAHANNLFLSTGWQPKRKYLKRRQTTLF